MTPESMVDQLVRKEVRALPLYAPNVGACPIDLSDNTNLWGAPPSAVRTLRETPVSSLTRYPSLYSEPLRASLLQYLALEGVPGLSVVTGCGSDDVIDATMRAFGGAGERIAFSSPTFAMIPVFAQLNGLVPIGIPLTDRFDVDAQRLVDCGAKITYLCAPNNPTATAVSRSAVEYVVSHARGIVLLDEAYAEFAPETFENLVAGNERVIVARTFSKAFGLAGLRVGFGVAHTRVAALLQRARGPYKVSSVAERAVLAALGPEQDALPWVRSHAALAIANRDRLREALRALGFAPLPSVANFILVPTVRALALAGSLREHGVLVRSFSDLPRTIPAFAESNGAALRIGVGPWAMMQILLDCLAEGVA